MKKILKMILIGIGFLLVLIILSVVLFFQFAPQIGESASGERLERIQKSTNYEKGKFKNTITTNMDMPVGNMIETFWEMLKGNENRQPKASIETLPFNKEHFTSASDSETVISWFGHSSLIVKINGKILLIDPVFGERSSMFSFMGPKRFDYSNQMDVDQLPEIDAVLISHDHYDHLDYETISKLKTKINRFYVPLGIGAHLEKWGVKSEYINELDWWDTANLEDSLELVCTPSRHFSGRAIGDRFKTLWCSWVIKGKSQRVFFGGDSGYFPGFKEIGEQYGPFNITLLECGQYDKKWSEIHMMPEETAQAHLDLKGDILMPIHWGKFTLALHPWKEPVQRLLKAAKEQDIRVSTPTVGDLSIIQSKVASEEWWKGYE